MDFSISRVIRGLLLLTVVSVTFFLSIPGVTQASNLMRPPNNLGIVGYWSFSEGSGTSTLDNSGNAHTGTLNNGTVWTTGQARGGLLFDGIDDYVVVSSDSSLNLRNNFSIFAWVKTTDTSAAIVSWGGSGTGGVDNGLYGLASFAGVTATGKIGVFLGGSWRNASTRFDDDAWHQIGYTFSSGGDLQFYFDGAPDGSVISTGSQFNDGPSNSLVFGREATSANNFPYSGKLDEVRVYGRALSSAEVALLYGSKSPVTVRPPEYGLVAGYGFNEGTGGTTSDLTNNGNTATLSRRAISRVQFKHVYTGTTNFATFDSSVTAGNLIVVAVSGHLGTGVSAVTDTLGNTYRMAGHVLASGNSTNADVWYAYNVTGGSATITVAEDYNDDVGLTIVEYSGFGTTDPFDVARVDSGTKTGTSFTTHDTGMIFGYWANEVASDATGAGGGFTTIFHDTGHFDFSEEKLNVAAGSYNISFGGSDHAADALIAVAFKARVGPSFVPGKNDYGTALSFNGTTDYVATNNQSYSLAAGSVSLWAYKTGSSTDPIVTGSYGGSGQQRAPTLYEHLGNLYWEFSDLTTQDTGVSFPASTWTHIVMTYDSSFNVAVYKNGVQVDTGSASDPGGFLNQVYIGAYGVFGSTSTNYFSGQIDDVRIYNRVLSAGEVANIYGQGYGLRRVTQNKSVNTVATPNLLGWWTFDGPSLTTTISTDSSGNGNNGTLSGGPGPTYGKIGQALSFDGIDDYVTTNASAVNLNVGTFAGWFKPSFSSLGVGNNEFFFDTDTARHAIFHDGVSGGMTMYNDGRQTDFFSATWNANQWYHFAFVYSKTGNIQKFYINGVEQSGSGGAGTWGSSALGTNLYIGHRIVELNNNYFSGSIDDVRIYNKILSDAEVLRLYNSGK